MQGFVVQQLKTLAGGDGGKQPNVLLPCGNFPDKWTVASAASLLKVNDPYNTGNYGSTSIADSVTNFQCKTTEKLEQQHQDEGTRLGTPQPSSCLGFPGGISSFSPAHLVILSLFPLIWAFLSPLLILKPSYHLQAFTHPLSPAFLLKVQHLAIL